MIAGQLSKAVGSEAVGATIADVCEQRGRARPWQDHEDDERRSHACEFGASRRFPENGIIRGMDEVTQKVGSGIELCRLRYARSEILGESLGEIVDDDAARDIASCATAHAVSHDPRSAFV